MKRQLPDFIKTARSNNHRLPVLLSGSPEWLKEQLADITELMGVSPSIWSDNRQSLPGATPWKKARKLLGQTIEYLVLDITEDIPADELGAVTGAVNGGGLLIFLAPPDLKWSSTSCFIRRARETFINADLLHWRENQGLTGAPPTLLRHQQEQEELPQPYKTADQQKAVIAAERVVTGHRRRPLVLTADRGRGKSAALGIAAARLMQERPVRILVTAPSQQAAETLFAHAAETIEQACISRFHIRTDTSEVIFVAPDDRVLNKPEGSLVMVDEAAAIPAPLLAELLKHYARIIFASTIHGYEGTGRGFAVRFHKTLEQLTPRWRSCNMEQPIRWSQGDPLERFLSQLLLLHSEPANSSSIAEARSHNVSHIALSSQELIDQPGLLNELFGLLVLAHYQTRPDDLRQILDQDNIAVSALMYRGHVAATALISKEGEFDQPLAEAVWAGKRRLKGHLLPQTLATHGGFAAAPELKWARIMRIAVHPEIQSEGIGQHLVARLKEECQNLGYDLIGSSFGATLDLVHFWQRCQLKPVHIGSTRNKASGCYSLVVCKGLSDNGLAFEKESHLRFSRILPYLLRDSLQQLEADLLLALLEQTEQADLTNTDIKLLNNFAREQLNYESCLPELQIFACSLLPKLAQELSEKHRQLLTDKLLLNRSWAESVARNRVKGKKAAEQELASLIAALLEAAKAP